ncbi:MAG: winged helix-turn-helix transcriptional regulator [Nitrospira sp.]|nr:winged helix-turn-helix transcriptional regulator [Nitrospira sp.]
MNCQATTCPIQVSKTLLAAKLFRGLGDPTRLSILEALQDGPKRVVDLCQATGRAQPNVSMHLACLRDCGLVESDPRGRETYYSLADAQMDAVLRSVKAVVDKIGPRLCECSRYEK